MPVEARIGKWGNSLAIRLPASLVKARGLAEGDAVNLELTTSTKADNARRKERERVIAEMGKLAVPLPPDYKFDRDEANSR